MTDAGSDRIRLERMAQADVPDVHALERICFPTPWAIEAYYRELGNPTAYYLVARADSRIIGYGGMWVAAGEAHVVTLAVSPGRRRRGVGRRLMEALLEEARRREARLVTLEVRMSNVAAQRLYGSMGFRTITFRSHYYPDTGEDAAVMALRLQAEGNRASDGRAGAENP